MRFLIDRCAGRRLAQWLQANGHDVVEAPSLGPDPGDSTLLEWAARQDRVLVTIDTDFGRLIFAEKAAHRGVVRLPDVPAAKRILLIQQVLAKHERDLQAGAVITVRGERIRVSRSDGS
jgi:predicted nuclease of predicted toxin-antitoxin system